MLKNSLTLLVLFVSTLGFTQDDKNFIISGNILNASECIYVLYDIIDDNSWHFVEEVKLDSTYKISVKPHGMYLIIFKSQGKSKQMYLDLNGPSKQLMSINFKYDSHIFYAYNEEEKIYNSYLLTDSDILQMQNEKKIYREE